MEVTHGGASQSQALIDDSATASDAPSPDGEQAQQGCRFRHRCHLSLRAAAAAAAAAGGSDAPEAPPLDIAKVMDVVAKIDATVKDSCHQRAANTVTGNVNSIRSYRRAVEYAKKTMPMVPL